MQKKIIFYIFLFLFSCNKIPDSIGNNNDLIIVTSVEDKDYIVPYIEGIINLTINTPIEESIFNVKWVDAKDFFQYKFQKNIFLISLKQPIDKTADLLIKKISQSKDNKLLAVNDVFAKDQLIVILNAFDSIQLKKILNDNDDWIFNTLDQQILQRYYTRVVRSKLNKGIMDTIINKFKIDLSIDENYKILKDEENFLWIGRGYPYRWIMINNLNAEDRDNLFNDYVKTIENNAKNIRISDYFKSIEYKKNYIKLSGLYEHIESDTGGPFIGYCFDDSTIDNYYCITGYVNNPGKSKYDLLKQLESIIINSRKVNDGI